MSSAVAAPAPKNEAERLARLRELMVLDSAPEAVFDSLARMASEVCGVPIALLSLIDEGRQWFKAEIGLPGVRETPRDVAFCAHAILGDEVFEVPDATQDGRFAGNPLVTGAPDIRFYAGAPLTLPSGECLGTLCVIDRRTRKLDVQQIATLRALARIATEALLMRRDLITRTLSVRSEYEEALATSEAQHRTIVEEQSELVSLARADGVLVYVNPAYARFFRRSPAELTGSNLFDLVEVADRDAVRERIDWVLSTGEGLAGENRMVVDREGEVWVAWANSLQRDAQGTALLRSVGRDVSARKRAEHELRRQTATLRSVTEALPAIISVVDGDLRYRFVNSAFECWYGTPREQILGRAAAEVLPPVDVERNRPWAARALGGETVQFERHYPERPGEPHLSVNYIPLRLDDGRMDGFIGVAQDITPHRQEQVRLQALAERDPLTGLLNRAGFESRLTQGLMDGGGASMALLYLDLDRFKPVNDLHGHPVGDQVLQMFAQRLGKLVRPSDAVARLGGDEFALLLAGVRELAHAQAVADKVLAAACTPFEVGALMLEIGASIGVAFGAEPVGGGQELLRRADVLLYQAKAGGRGRQAVDTGD